MLECAAYHSISRTCMPSWPASGRLAGYEATRRFYEIGTLDGLAQTDAYLRGNAMNVSDYTSRLL